MMLINSTAASHLDHSTHLVTHLPDNPGGVFSNSIKLMLERQKCTLYQQEMLLQRANITLYQHAVRKSKNHTLQAGYAAREAKIYTLAARLRLRKLFD